MSAITNLTPQQLRQAADLKEEIGALENQLNQLVGGSSPAKPAAAKPAPRKKGGMSAEGKARIIAAQKARWAKIKAAKSAAKSAVKPAAKPAPKKKGGMSAEGKARIIAAQKARWAKIKAAKAAAPTPQPAAKPAGQPAAKGKLSAAAKAALSAKLKAFWAKKKAAGKK
jgi:hypothetical protein